MISVNEHLNWKVFQLEPKYDTWFIYEQKTADENSTSLIKLKVNIGSYGEAILKFINYKGLTRTEIQKSSKFLVDETEISFCLESN